MSSLKSILFEWRFNLFAFALLAFTVVGTVQHLLLFDLSTYWWTGLGVDLLILLPLLWLNIHLARPRRGFQLTAPDSAAPPSPRSA